MPRQKKKYTRSTTQEINVLTKAEKGYGDANHVTSSSSLSAQNSILEESEELEIIEDQRPDFRENGNQVNTTGSVSPVTSGGSALLSASVTAEAADISSSSVRMNGKIPNTGVLESCSRLEQSQSETRVEESVSRSTTNERSVFGARTSEDSSSRPSSEAVLNDQASVSELHTASSSSFSQRSSKLTSTQNTLRSMTVHQGYDDDDFPGNRNGSQDKTQHNMSTSFETTREISEERIESSSKSKLATVPGGTGELRGLMKKVLTLQYAAYSISNIRKWLQRMEVEVPSSLDYHDCNQYEESVKLKHQKDLYDEIKRYTDHVCHTFNLCRVLMQDKEVCRTEDQYNSLKNLVEELEPKWTYICGLFTILSQKFETEPITPVAGAPVAAASPSDSDSPEGFSPCCKLCAFLLPIYLLLLLLLFIAFILIPAWCECENSWCYYKNSYRNSFNLMLDYPSGSPPV